MSTTLPAEIEAVLDIYEPGRPTDDDVMGRLRDARDLLPWERIQEMARNNGLAICHLKQLGEGQAVAEMVALCAFRCGIVWGRLAALAEEDDDDQT